MSVTVTSSIPVRSSNDLKLCKNERSSGLVSVAPSSEAVINSTTALQARSSAGNLRPLLRGKLTFASSSSKLKSKSDDGIGINSSTPSKLVWEGSWWLGTAQSSEQSDSSSTTVSSFRYERTSLDNSATVSPEGTTNPDTSNNALRSLTADAYFSGSFFINPSSNNSSPKTKPSRREVKEQNLLLRFKLTDRDKAQYDVFGSGHNSFGQFLIEGTYDTTTHILCCVRNYLPCEFNFQSKTRSSNCGTVLKNSQNLSQKNKLKACVQKSRSISSETIVCVKKSGRVKRPNKFFQSFYLDSPKPEDGTTDDTDPVPSPIASKRPRSSNSFALSCENSVKSKLTSNKKAKLVGNTRSDIVQVPCENVNVQERFEGHKDLLRLLRNVISLDKLDGNLITSKLFPLVLTLNTNELSQLNATTTSVNRNSLNFSSLNCVGKEIERLFRHCLALHKHSKRSVDRLSRLLEFFLSSFETIKTKVQSLVTFCDFNELEINDFDLFEEKNLLSDFALNETDPISEDEAAVLPRKFSFAASFDVQKLFDTFELKTGADETESDGELYNSNNNGELKLEELDSETIKTLNDNAEFVSPPGKGG